MPVCSMCQENKPDAAFYFLKNPRPAVKERPYRIKRCKLCVSKVQRRRRAKCMDGYRLKWRIWWQRNGPRYNVERRLRYAAKRAAEMAMVFS